MKAHDDRPISERIQRVIQGDDPTLLREVQKLEQLAAGHVSYVAANGRFPHWSTERWLAVGTFLIAIATSSVAGVWVAGGEWRGVKNDVSLLQSDVSSMKADLKLLISAVAQDPTIITEPDVRPDRGRGATARPRPVFPRSDRFSGVGR